MPQSVGDNDASQHALRGVSAGPAGWLVIEFSLVLNYVPLPCLRSGLIFRSASPAVGLNPERASYVSVGKEGDPAAGVLSASRKGARCESSGGFWQRRSA
jgi:hypothetical protein